MDEPNPNAELIKSARRAQWACGLCLGLMFVMGLSGIASITLLHDDPLYTGSTGGIEGTTLEVVISLRWLIELLHEWGGYVGIVLAGWAALAVFSFARRIRRGDNLDWRRTARWVGPAGILGGGLIIASLLLLIASGVAAGGFVDHIGSRYNDDLSGIDKSTGLVDAREARSGRAWHQSPHPSFRATARLRTSVRCRPRRDKARRTRRIVAARLRLRDRRSRGRLHLPRAHPRYRPTRARPRRDFPLCVPPPPRSRLLSQMRARRRAPARWSRPSPRSPSARAS
jgi:hypothetical protein